MSNGNSAVSTLIGIVVVVILGLVALWIAQLFLGFIWQHVWWFAGGIAAVIFILLLIGAVRTRGR